MKKYVITIARGFGSGGKAIGVELGKRLGISCYEKEILRMASEQSGINESLFWARDEKLAGSYLKNVILKPVPHNYVVEPSDRNFIGDNNLFSIQSDIIRVLASTQSCIIVGKCADSVLDPDVKALRVFIDAPLQNCVRSIMERMSVDAREAERLILKTNKYRSEYYKYYTGGKNWRDPLNYDICLNTGMISRENCVSVIMDTLREKLGPLE